MPLNIFVQPRGGELIGEGIKGFGESIGEGLKQRGQNKKMRSSLENILETAYGYDKEQLAGMSLGDLQGAAEGETIKAANARQKLQEDILKTQLEAAQRAQKQQEALSRILSLAPGIRPETMEAPNPEREAANSVVEILKNRQPQTYEAVLPPAPGPDASWRQTRSYETRAAAADEEARKRTLASQMLDRMRVQRASAERDAMPATVERPAPENPMMSQLRTELDQGTIGPDQVSQLMTMMSRGTSVPPGFEVTSISMDENGRPRQTLSKVKTVTFDGIPVGIASSETEVAKVNDKFIATKDAVDAIDRMIEISKQGVGFWGSMGVTEKAQKLDTLAKTLMASLRTEIVGPGAVTEKELEILKNIASNPASFQNFILGNSEIRLEELRSKLERGLRNTVRTMRNGNQEAVDAVFGGGGLKADNFLMP